MGQGGAQGNDGLTLRYAQKHAQKYAQKVRTNVRTNVRTKIRTSPRNTQRCVLKQGTFQMMGRSVLRTFSIDFLRTKMYVKMYAQNFYVKMCVHNP